MIHLEITEEEADFLRAVLEGWAPSHGLPSAKQEAKCDGLIQKVNEGIRGA